jgi:hypothetical protein
MKIPTIITFISLLFSSTLIAAPKPPTIQFQVAPLTQARVFVSDRLIVVSINNQTPQTVAPTDSYLWAEYQKGYIKYGDFDHDKVQELALLTSISYGATNPCYHIYHYSMREQRYLPSGEPIRCNL